MRTQDDRPKLRRQRSHALPVVLELVLLDSEAKPADIIWGPKHFTETDSPKVDRDQDMQTVDDQLVVRLKTPSQGRLTSHCLFHTQTARLCIHYGGLNLRLDLH